MVVDVRVLCPEPELGGAVLGPDVDEAGVEGDCEGVFGVLEADVRVHELALVGGEEGVGADEVHFWSGAEDGGDYARAVLVGVDFGEEPFWCGG